MKPKYSNVFAVFLAILYIFSVSFISEPINKDLEMLRNIYKKLNSDGADENKTLYCKIGVTSVTNIPDKGTLPEQIVEVYLNKNLSIYINSEMKILEDNTDAFTILYKDKVILWRNSVRKKSSELNKIRIGTVQDTLFSLLKVHKVSEKIENNKTLKRIETTMESNSQARYNVKEMNFIVDEKNKNINKLEIIYLLPVQSLLSVQYAFYKVEMTSKSKKNNSSSKDFIFDSNGKLKTEYSGYKIRDVRRK